MGSFIVLCSLFAFAIRLVQLKDDIPGPFVSGEWFRSKCDHIINKENYDKLVPKKVNATIFAEVDDLKYVLLFQPKNKVPYYLFTHSSDKNSTNEAILKDENLVRWFATNIVMPRHLKLTGLPLGIADNSTDQDRNDQALVVEKQFLAKAFGARSDKIYLNYADLEEDSFEHIETICGDNEMRAHCRGTKVPYAEYLVELGKSRYSVNLIREGDPPDSHRTWEAIALGTIPVVLNSTAYTVFHGERVIIAHNITEISMDSINKVLEDLPLGRGSIYRTFWMNAVFNITKSDVTTTDTATPTP